MLDTFYTPAQKNYFCTSIWKGGRENISLYIFNCFLCNCL